MTAPFMHEIAYCHQGVELDCVEARRRSIKAATASGAVVFEH